jgi:hypothetical protein
MQFNLFSTSFSEEIEAPVMFFASVTIAAGFASLALTTKSHVICGFAQWVRKSPVYTTVP